MRSIRRSLTAYLLLLLAFALLGMGFLIDRSAYDAFHKRQLAETDKVDREYDEKTKAAQKVFDDELLSEAQTLSRGLTREVRSRIGPRSSEEALWQYQLGTLIAGQGASPWTAVITSA